jgi:ATP-dependent Clp protease adaptor protein ClpS
MVRRARVTAVGVIAGPPISARAATTSEPVTGSKPSSGGAEARLFPQASSEPGLGHCGIVDLETEHAGPVGDGWAYPDGMAQTAPVETERPVGDEDVVPDVPWIVIVWNDPINLMSYVVYVFQKLFGFPREKATRLMLDVHQKGRAVVSTGPRERCEFDVSRLHAHGLWATMQKDR